MVQITVETYSINYCQGTVMMVDTRKTEALAKQCDKSPDISYCLEANQLPLSLWLQTRTSENFYWMQVAVFQKEEISLGKNCLEAVTKGVVIGGLRMLACNVHWYQLQT